MRSRAFYQNNYSLIFQFIVSEYLLICQLFKDLEGELASKSSESLKEILMKLKGSQEKRLNLSSGYLEDGLLKKLKNKCLQFQECHDKKLSGEKLAEHVQKIQNLCDQAWKALEISKAVTALNLFIPKMQSHLRRIGRIIAHLFLQFVEDEAILFFLLQNYQKLNNAYQPKFVVNLFSKMFPKGLKEAEIYIIKQYSQRGYHQLLPQITEISKKLEKSPLEVYSRV